MKNYKIGLYVALVLSLAMGVVTYEYIFYRQIPDTLYLEKGKVEEVEFALPVTAKLVDSKKEYVETWESGQIMLNENTVREANEYTWKLKLFGIVPLKDIDIKVVDEQEVYPIGTPIGIYVKTDGVLVAGVGKVKMQNGMESCPCENVLQKGDYILSVNGESVSKKRDVITKVKEYGANPLILKIRRNHQISEVKLTAACNEAGQYQIGAWIRDSAQGIGTLTYIDNENHFGALGHGINDIDTAELMEIEDGGVYETQILGIKKGSSGEPGEITGVIRFMEDSKEGTIETNTPNGIYGTMDFSIENAGFTEEMCYPIAWKQDIQIGKAQILCTINGKRKFYDVEIVDIDYGQSEGNRGLVIEITDEALLSQTGGIVQGMSGSPILQNGKVIGAVTHVFVNNPTKGYGIFIETMLEY